MIQFSKDQTAEFFADREQTQLFLVFGAVTYLDGKTPKQIPGYRLKLERIPGSGEYRLVWIEYRVTGNFIKRIQVNPQYLTKGDLEMVWPQFEAEHKKLYEKFGYYNFMDSKPGVYPGSKPEEGEES